MGLVHEAVGPPPAEQVAGALPALDDSGVADAVALAMAYAEVRRTLLALSGISLMQNLSLGSPTSLAGVVVTARMAIEGARSQLGRPFGSRNPQIRWRAELLGGACEVLATELLALSRDGRAAVPRESLELVRGVLARTSLVEAGMRQFSSVSCAHYGGDHGQRHEHLAPHPPTHGHHH